MAKCCSKSLWQKGIIYTKQKKVEHAYSQALSVVNWSKGSYTKLNSLVC